MSIKKRQNGGKWDFGKKELPTVIILGGFYFVFLN